MTDREALIKVIKIFVILNIYALLLEGRVLGLWEHEEDARAAFDAIKEPMDHDLVIEEWPVNQQKTRFNVRVVAIK